MRFKIFKLNLDYCLPLLSKSQVSCAPCMSFQILPCVIISILRPWFHCEAVCWSGFCRYYKFTSLGDHSFTLPFMDLCNRTVDINRKKKERSIYYQNSTGNCKPNSGVTSSLVAGNELDRNCLISHFSDLVFVDKMFSLMLMLVIYVITFFIVSSGPPGFNYCYLIWLLTSLFFFS